mmetsp:Transcript_7844/g.8978  ORF Transcript_7844/g.8978 Transcript_7844/m.8978 type:complete len:102 (-) Transcript_7844:1131-1436(-)
MESLRNRNNSPMHLSHPSEQITQQIFMFVNPLSGSREGEAYSELPSMVYDYTLDNNVNVTLSITNLLERESVEATKQDIADALEGKIETDPRDINSVIILL